MVLVNLPVSGCPTIWITVGQGSTALAVDAGGGCVDLFTLSFLSSSSLWATARYRLKYRLKGTINPNQPTIYWNMVISDKESAGVIKRSLIFI